MLGLVAWLSAVGLIATEIELTQRESRHQLERRFAIRADSAAQFTEVYAPGCSSGKPRLSRALLS